MHLPPPLSLPCGGQGALKAGASACGGAAGLVLAWWLSALADLSLIATSLNALAGTGLAALAVVHATRTVAGQLVWDGRGQWHLAPPPDGIARPVRPVWAMDAGCAILVALHDGSPGRGTLRSRRTWTIVRRGVAGPERWARVRTCLASQQPAAGADGASWAP